MVHILMDNIPLTFAWCCCCFFFKFNQKGSTMLSKSAHFYLKT